MTAEGTLAQLHDWHDFYLLGGTAAATLLGLLFIAVTLNADIILASGRQDTRQIAEQAFQNFIAALVTALLLLFPGLTVSAVASFLLAEGVVMSVWVAIRMRRVWATDTSLGRIRAWRRLAPAVLAFGLMIFVGWRFPRDADSDLLPLIGCATLLLLLSATATSWDLLIRIAELRHSLSKR